MRDGKRTICVRFDTHAACHECGAEPVKQEPWRWARRHAEKTGHSPTVTVSYDIHKANIDEVKP